ncbi:unnamed protein product [Ectocarpus fasciculatus]
MTHGSHVHEWPRCQVESRPPAKEGVNNDEGAVGVRLTGDGSTGDNAQATSDKPYSKEDESLQVVLSANSPFDYLNDDYDGLLLGSNEFDFDLDPEFKLAPVVSEESTAVPRLGASGRRVKAEPPATTRDNTSLLWMLSTDDGGSDRWW